MEPAGAGTPGSTPGTGGSSAFLVPCLVGCLAAAGFSALLVAAGLAYWLLVPVPGPAPAPSRPLELPPPRPAAPADPGPPVEVRPPSPPASKPAVEDPEPPVPVAPAAAPRGEAAILAEVARLAGLERRVDPVDGKTVLFELLPGYRELGSEDEDERGDVSAARIEVKARVRADASLPETVETLTVELRLDSRGKKVLSARRSQKVDADDAELEALTRKLQRR